MPRLRSAPAGSRRTSMATDSGATPARASPVTRWRKTSWASTPTTATSGFEAMIGGLPAHVAPVQRQLPLVHDGSVYLLNDAGEPSTLRVPHAVRTAGSPRSGRPGRVCRVLLQVADDSGNHPLLPDAIDYEEALADMDPEYRGRRSSRHPMISTYLHRWHHRDAEGCAVAAARHLHRSDGRPSSLRRGRSRRAFRRSRTRRPRRTRTR